MAEKRPKLLVLGGPEVDPAAVHASFGDRYEIVVADSEEGKRLMQGDEIAAVMLATGEIAPVMSDNLGEQLTTMLNAIHEGVCLSGDTGEITWANTRFRSFPRATRTRVELGCRRALDRFRSMARAEGGAARVVRFGITLRRSGRYFRVRVSPVESQQGEVRQVVAVVRDVTGRERMRQKMSAIDRAGRELMHLEVETIEKMHASDRLRLLEDKIVQTAHDLLQFDHFAIRLLNPRTNELELVIATGMPQKATEISLFATVEGNGISGYVASTGRSYVCDDARQDKRYVFGLDRAGSSLTVPLRLFDQVRGVFNIESRELHAFTNLDRQFAEIFAHYVTMSLHILNLLVVERYTTRQSATGAVEGELSAPLNDLAAEAEWLRERAGMSGEAGEHLDRILKDVAAIKRRLKNVSRGAGTLLGAEEALGRVELDLSLQGRRVLVVDNDEGVRDTIRDVLTSRGAEVVTCEDGTSAVRLLEQWEYTYDADEGFDVVLSDISMDDKTGYDVFAAAKRVSPHLPVILMTGFGYDPHHSIVRASQEGLQCVLFKPFQAEAMVTEVRKAVESPKPKGSGG